MWQLVMSAPFTLRSGVPGLGRWVLERTAARRDRGRPVAALALVATLLTSSASEVRAASPTAAGPRGPGAAAPALPRQFSVEVAAGGVLFVDGTRLGAAAELGRWAQRALAGARFAGAVVFGDERRDAAAITAAMDLLRRAGFADVRRAGRPAPAELSAVRAPAAASVVGASKAPVSSPASKPSRTPSVALATVGLHVDGALNREPHRGRLVRVFEREFAAFRRCHERAEQHARGASFGVDLLIPKTGGRAKVRQTRTRLESKAFRACMLSAFEAIRFAPPASARPEIVSYSVLFKPSAR